MKRLTEAQVVEIIHRLLAQRSVRAVADDLCVSPSYVQKVASGNLRPGWKILKAMGLRRIVLYEREGL